VLGAGRGAPGAGRGVLGAAAVPRGSKASQGKNEKFLFEVPSFFSAFLPSFTYTSFVLFGEGKRV
jgi:hypothetical protein